MNSEITYYGKYQALDRLVIWSVFLFSILSSLYYYLRFQFNLVQIVPVLQFSILSIGITFFFIKVFSSGLRLNSFDQIVFLFFIYNIMFFFFGIFQFGLSGVTYGLKDKISNILLYFMLILCFRKLSARILLNLIIILCSIVSIIYAAEFVNKFVFGGDFFAYTYALRDYASDLNQSGNPVGITFEKGDIYTLIRFPGPMGYNNSTGFFIVIGINFLTAFIVYRGISIYRALLIMACWTGLILTLARTSIFAAIVSSSIIFISGIYNKKISLLTVILALASFVALILLMIIMGIIDTTAYGSMLNPERILNTIRLLLNHEHFQWLYDKYERNPVAIISGLGFSFPGAKNFETSPVVSEDVFFVQLVSQYGLILSPLFLAMFFINFDALYRRIKKDDTTSKHDMGILWGTIGITASIFVSILHTNAIIVPQINAVIMIIFGIFSVIAREDRIYQPTRDTSKSEKNT
jgi:hypothetical protein